jgi:photosystem II stability/assembly factor-like uncharacterized protein
MKTRLLLGTRKGLIAYSYNENGWNYESLHFKGIPVSMIWEDERDGTQWACLDHGHWGTKLHRSNDHGQTWEEIEAPAYPEGSEIKDGVPAITKYIWAIAGGGNDYPDRLWLGTVPGGLFKSEDKGNTWSLVDSLWNHHTRKDMWFGGGFDHPGIHSIVVDPKNNDRVFVGISCAGVFETVDSGETWIVRNNGMRADFLPDPTVEAGFDPHILAPFQKDVNIMWQQNHCGVYKTHNGAQNWIEVSQEVGPVDFGFACEVDQDNPEVAWVIPMVSDEKRVAVRESLCVCRTDDGGINWKELRNGLPQEATFDIVYRHALGVKGDQLVFGTTTGNLYTSTDRGDSWSAISHNLPMIYSVKLI